MSGLSSESLKLWGDYHYLSKCKDTMLGRHSLNLLPSLQIDPGTYLRFKSEYIWTPRSIYVLVSDKVTTDAHFIIY